MIPKTAYLYNQNSEFLYLLLHIYSYVRHNTQPVADSAKWRIYFDIHENRLSKIFFVCSHIVAHIVSIGIYMHTAIIILCGVCLYNVYEIRTRSISISLVFVVLFIASYNCIENIIIIIITPLYRIYTS